MSKTSLRNSTPEQFYVEFKRCYFDNVCTVLSESDKSEKNTEQDNIELLKALIMENKGLGQKQMYNLCLIGRTLKCLKEVYKMNNTKLDEIVNNKSKFNRNWRDFYIRLYEFAMVFPKIMFVDISTITISNVYNNWSKLTDFIIKEKHFWI